MVRPVLIELALFLTPFALYVIFLWATRAGVIDVANWSWPRVAWLFITSLVLMIGSFIVLANWSGSPPGSTYTPAHMENGVLVPGQAK